MPKLIVTHYANGTRLAGYRSHEYTPDGVFYYWMTLTTKSVIKTMLWVPPAWETTPV